MTISAPPLITIGITSYMAADTVARAIESAFEQDWPNKEIILVDDASTDATHDILRDIEGRNDIRIFRQPVNKGVAAARNVILREAKGDYIAFFDDDDISVPERLSRQYEILSRKIFALCHTARRQKYPDGSERIEPTPGSNGHAVKGRDMFARILTGKPVEDGFGSLATCSLMMPRSVWERVGEYDETFRRSEDMDYTLRFALMGGDFIGCAKPLVIQTMTRSGEKNLTTEKEFHEKIYRKYSGELGRQATDFALKWLELRHLFLTHRKFFFASRLIALMVRHPVLSARKIFWALPNIGFNRRFARFHKVAS
jgi:glycosyltransferase involved in cell wall biosynthesis